MTPLRAIICVLAALALFALGVFIMLSRPANASGTCAPINLMVASLLASYGEEPMWEALMEPGDMRPVPIIWFVNRKTGTFTLVVNPAPNVFCMMAKGSGFDLANIKFERPIGPGL